MIQLRRLFHLGSNQILWKDFGFSCLSHWRLLTASDPEFPQTAAGWRRVIQARFAIRPLTPPPLTLLRTAHDPRTHAWKTLARVQKKCAQNFNWNEQNNLICVMDKKQHKIWLQRFKWICVDHLQEGFVFLLSLSLNVMKIHPGR